MNDHGGKSPIKRRLEYAVLVVLLLGLVVELLVRPFWPELVKSESALGEIVRMLLGLFMGMGS